MTTKLFNTHADYLVSTGLLDLNPDSPRFTSLRNNEPDEVFDPFETICKVFEVRSLVASIVIRFNKSLKRFIDFTFWKQYGVGVKFFDPLTENTEIAPDGLFGNDVGVWEWRYCNSAW